ncbi:hypothetical protein [Flavobacterium mesophilum]|uniref:hypothetical protein n=1 Tax=Flavobacterium mesophilum TaxID=3143495 RepID=UPI0031E0CE8D
MKNIIYILFFAQSLVCFAQEPPAIFKLKYSFLKTDSLHVLDDYKINSPSVEYYKKSKNNYLTPEYWKEYKDNIKLDNEFLYIYMGHAYPRENDIIILNIFKDTARMSIFIKINFDLDFGEKLYLKNLNFEEGNYFIDLSLSNLKVEKSAQFHKEKEVDLSSIKKYSVTQNTLNQKI